MRYREDNVCVAQWLVLLTVNQRVVGSSPTTNASKEFATQRNVISP